MVTKAWLDEQLSALRLRLANSKTPGADMEVGIRMILLEAGVDIIDPASEVADNGPMVITGFE